MKRIGWIDGLKGLACIFVMLGHSVACIFPNVFFGNTIVSHTYAEEWIHGGPLMLVFNSTAMVSVFFTLSGLLIAKKEINEGIIERLFFKYLKYLPMVLLGTVSCYLVMRIDAVNSIKISNISYASGYVNGYNNFAPTLSGQDGLIKDLFVNSFFEGSIYNNTLWFIPIIFWGGLLIEELARDIKNKKVLVLTLVLLFIFFSRAEFLGWKIQFMKYICLGAMISFVKIEEKEFFNKLSYLLVVFGCYRIACPNDMAGIYAPIKYITGLDSYFPGWGIVLLLVGIQMNSKIQEVLSGKVSRFLAKNSFGIYVIQWAIIISLGCGLTGLTDTYTSLGYCMSGVIGITISSLVIITLAWIYNRFIYGPFLLVTNKLKEKRIEKNICDIISQSKK